MQFLGSWKITKICRFTIDTEKYYDFLLYTHREAHLASHQRQPIMMQSWRLTAAAAARRAEKGGISRLQKGIENFLVSPTPNQVFQVNWTFWVSMTCNLTWTKNMTFDELAHVKKRSECNNLE